MNKILVLLMVAVLACQPAMAGDRHGHGDRHGYSERHHGGDRHHRGGRHHREDRRHHHHRHCSHYRDDYRGGIYIDLGPVILRD